MREAYFVRLTTELNAYLHPENGEYRVKKGFIGAAIFDFENANKLIESVDQKNLEIVHITKVIPIGNNAMKM